MTVLKFPTLEKPASEVLSDAADLKDVVVIGVTQDGLFYCDLSGNDLAYTNLLLDQAKRWVMDAALGE